MISACVDEIAKLKDQTVTGTLGGEVHDFAVDLWRAELGRVEEVLDARLKHLEEK